MYLTLPLLAGALVRERQHNVDDRGLRRRLAAAAACCRDAARRLFARRSAASSIC